MTVQHWCRLERTAAGSRSECTCGWKSAPWTTPREATKAGLAHTTTVGACTEGTLS